MTLIVDASVAVKWIVPETLHPEALVLLGGDEPLEAPDLLLSETANVIWVKHRRGEISRQQGEAGLLSIRAALDRLHPSEVLYERALALAFELDHPAYDCFYIACAEAAGGDMVTADRRLCALAGHAGLGSRVHLLGGAAP